MEAILILVLFVTPSLVLFYSICLKLKTMNKLISIFDRNKKAIENLNISDYKLGSGHIYQ